MMTALGETNTSVLGANDYVKPFNLDEVASSGDGAVEASLRHRRLNRHKSYPLRIWS